MLGKNIEETNAQENSSTICEICNTEANLTEFHKKYICNDCIELIKSIKKNKK